MFGEWGRKVLIIKANTLLSGDTLHVKCIEMTETADIFENSIFRLPSNYCLPCSRPYEEQGILLSRY